MDEKVFTFALKEAADKVGRESLSLALKINKNTLKSQLNPHLDTAWFQARKVPALMDFSGDMGPLHALAALFDHVAVPIEEPPEGMTRADWVKHIARLSNKSGATLSKLGKSLEDDGKVDRREGAELLPLAWETVRALVGLIRALERI